MGEIGRAYSGNEGDKFHATASGFHGISADDIFPLIVSSFDEDGWEDCFDEIERGVFFEHDDGVDNF